MAYANDYRSGIASQKVVAVTIACSGDHQFPLKLGFSHYLEANRRSYHSYPHLYMQWSTACLSLNFWDD